MTLNEIRQKRAEHWEKMKAFLNEHQDASGHLSADDTATYENMSAEMDRFDADVQRAEDVQRRDEELNRAVNEPLYGTPAKGKGDAGTGRSSDEYNKEFLNYIRTRRPSNALQEGTSSEGGYLVPTEFERALFAGRDKTDPIFELAGRLYLGALEKNVPYVASHATATLVAEEGSYGGDDPVFGQVVFHAYKWGVMIKSSDELLADAVFDIRGYLAGDMSRAIGKAQASYFWGGNGTGQPLGVMNCAGTGVTTSGNKPTADEVIDLYYSLAEQYRGVSAFAMNDGTVKEIRKLKTGEGQYLWAPGLNGAPDTLLGRPLRTSEYIDEIAAGKSIIAFGDFLGCYKIADRQGFEFKIYDQLYGETGQIGFRGAMRSDGRGILASEGIKLMKIHA